MRVLMLAQFYPPIMGGIEGHVRNLSRELAARGHQVSVATLRHPGMPPSEMDGAVRVHRVRATMQRLSALFSGERHHSPPFPDPEVTLALRGIIRKERPDIIHAHNWMVHSFLPLKRWSGAKLVMTLHDCELLCAQMRMMYMDRRLCEGPSVAKCLRCSANHYGPIKGAVTLAGNGLTGGVERSAVDLFLPVSGAVATANRLSRGPARFQVVPNFVPDDIAGTRHFEKGDGPVLDGLPGDEFILQVGDLVPDKGINVLIDAYAGLASAPPLVLIGRRFPTSPAHLPPGVTVIEGMPHHLVMQAWTRCMFGVVASTCLDACPTTTVEAMASGRPVIGSRIGGIIDQIAEGETGLLVPPGDPVALRQAMSTLIADPDLRSRMGSAALAHVKEFQCGRVVTTIERLYRELCVSGAARSAPSAPLSA